MTPTVFLSSHADHRSRVSVRALVRGLFRCGFRLNEASSFFPNSFMEVAVSTPVWERRRDDWVIAVMSECVGRPRAIFFMARQGDEGSRARIMDEQEFDLFATAMYTLYSAIEGRLRDIAREEEHGARVPKDQLVETSQHDDFYVEARVSCQGPNRWSSTIAIYERDEDSMPILSFTDGSIELLAKDLADAAIFVQATHARASKT
jgi:hypothetical protein